jgi:hypothetical protein
MSGVGFETTIPAFERGKPVHALDCAAIVIGWQLYVCTLLVMALESTQPLTEISTRNLPGGKKRPARRADNLSAIDEPNVWKCGSLNLSQH